MTVWRVRINSGWKNFFHSPLLFELLTVFVLLLQSKKPAYWDFKAILKFCHFFFWIRDHHKIRFLRLHRINNYREQAFSCLRKGFYFSRENQRSEEFQRRILKLIWNSWEWMKMMMLWLLNDGLKLDTEMTFIFYSILKQEAYYLLILSRNLERKMLFRYNHIWS